MILKELNILLHTIYELSGYDFTGYSRASVTRRVQHRMKLEKMDEVVELNERIRQKPVLLKKLLGDLMIHVTEMFRDPLMFTDFREKVIPVLRTYPFIRIWHAGCSTGEEVYSMAILLHEEGLLERSRIYATDFSDKALEQAKSGVFPVRKMKDFTMNYMKFGGKKSFSEYYTARYDGAIFRPFLKKNIIFARHNLVTDRSFNEFNVIFCRNVLIYFETEMQDHVHGLIFQSLTPLGFLVLGSKESVQFTPYAQHYDKLSQEYKIYRKIARHDVN